MTSKVLRNGLQLHFSCILLYIPSSLEKFLNRSIGVTAVERKMEARDEYCSADEASLFRQQNGTYSADDGLKLNEYISSPDSRSASRRRCQLPGLIRAIWSGSTLSVKKSGHVASLCKYFMFNFGRKTKNLTRFSLLQNLWHRRCSYLGE